jgi:hypothetical protein
VERPPCDNSVAIDEEHATAGFKLTNNLRLTTVTAKLLSFRTMLLKHFVQLQTIIVSNYLTSLPSPVHPLLKVEIVSNGLLKVTVVSITAKHYILYSFCNPSLRIGG